MGQSRYRESRILTRSLCRLPGEPRAQFIAKLARLRAHFERFNVDVADLCQWLMSLRPKGDVGNSAALFWEFFLEPAISGVDADEKQRDGWRLFVFDAAVDRRPLSGLAGRPVSENLQAAIRQVSEHLSTQTVRRLFERLRGLDRAHRLVLLKAAAEWIVARYQRGIENWRRQREEWEKEKDRWEAQHAQLTEEVREQFTDIFKNLVEHPDGEGSKGLRRKNPRLCSHARLSQNKDNCVYAGEQGHGPLCWKYVTFVSVQKKHNNKFNEKYFADNAEIYLRERQRLDKPNFNLTDQRRHEEAPRLLYQAVPACKVWFKEAWKDYLIALQLNESTIIGHGRMPHCRKIGDAVWERSNCEWNPHTHLCAQYKQALALLDPATLKLEADYRQWRKDYLAGPRKPSFRYPSSRNLPMPKIFGDRFYQIDFDHSILRLRLDDMDPGEWIEFGFVPWPKDYQPGKNEVNVTSVHISFVGSRARAGFRFEVSHRQSRFGCSQDELDELRSRQFPRQAQDAEFLKAARNLLHKSFSADMEHELRILAVDLGETGAQAAVYQGKTHQQDVPLPIVKIDQCYPGLPEVLKKDERLSPPPKFPKDKDWRGLRREHVGHHLQQLTDGAAGLAKHRQPVGPGPATLRESDYRGLTRHMRWMIRDWARHNAAQVIAVAEAQRCDLIVFESLRGFRPRGYDQMDIEQKRRLAFFAYGQVRRKVVEKAVERGMRVVTVPYGYSSQICSACGHVQQDKARLRKNKRKRLFHCECGDRQRRGKKDISHKPATAVCACQAKLNSDANAARVLARVYWGEIALPTREQVNR